MKETKQWAILTVKFLLVFAVLIEGTYQIIDKFDLILP